MGIGKVDDRQQCRATPAALALIVSVLVWGCGEPEKVDEVPEPVDRPRAVVEANLSTIDEVMVDAARKRAFREAVDVAIEYEARRPFSERVEDGLRYSTVFEREYIDGGLDPIFVDRQGLTSRGEEVVATLNDAHRHAIEPETLHREEIAELRTLRAEWEELESVDDGFSPRVEEVEALVGLVAEAGDEGGEKEGLSVIVDAVSEVDDTDQGPEALQRVRDYNRSEAEHYADRARVLAELELRIADGLLRYAREMRHKNMERVDWRQLRDIGGSTELILQRMQQTLRDVAEASDDEVADVIRGLEPSHRQYRKLLAATDRYRRFVDDGGWSWVRPFTVEKGARSAHVEALRSRLEAEGFDASPASDETSSEDEGAESSVSDGPEVDRDDGPDGEGADSDEEAMEAFDPRVVDDTLIEGIRQYQKTHQFVPDGDPTPGFWRSLNISAEDRLEQMELTLQRWRESAIEDDEDFIMVNIPDFHAEVWAEGERRMRFSVVVGNNRRVCDPEEERWVYPDKTPTVMSTMDHIMINPPWYVPRRIVEETLMPRVEENEDYFEEAGYEKVTMDDGREVVRQLPGEDNALGLVKFIFPNEHNVFLHDTPQTQYFDYGIRAFSHGCIRVSKPLELAQFLLGWMGRDDVDIDEVIESETTRRYDFDRKLPVFLEYYTVWVDDDGDPHFLADIYQRDGKRRADDPDEFMECTPRIEIDEETPEFEEGEDEEDKPEDLDEDLGP